VKNPTGVASGFPKKTNQDDLKCWTFLIRLVISKNCSRTSSENSVENSRSFRFGANHLHMCRLAMFVAEFRSLSTISPGASSTSLIDSSELRVSTPVKQLIRDV
jgi:hypothetical protein